MGNLLYPGAIRADHRSLGVSLVRDQTQYSQSRIVTLLQPNARSMAGEVRHAGRICREDGINSKAELPGIKIQAVR